MYIVTGAAGFIGSNIVADLEAAGLGRLPSLTGLAVAISGAISLSVTSQLMCHPKDCPTIFAALKWM